MIFITIFFYAVELIIKKVIKTCYLYLSICVKQAGKLITAHIVKRLHFLPNIIMWILYLIFPSNIHLIKSIIEDNHLTLTTITRLS